jgi:hypothetical protein
MGGKTWLAVGLGLSVPLVILLLSFFPTLRFLKEDTRAYICAANLERIATAKEAWAVSNGKQLGDMPTAKDLNPHLQVLFELLTCPEGGTYSIRAIGEMPTCSVPGHELK